jgi:molybdopterin molybdotransferase
MLGVEAARQRILQVLHPKGAEVLPFEAVLGRVLAQDVVADSPVPPFAQSAMDGFAVRAADTSLASPDHPITLTVLGTLGAGHLGAWTLGAGTAVRIMTGAPLPDGADAVVKREDTAFTAEAVTLFQPAHPHDHVIPPGRDIPAGTLVVRSGEVITPAVIGLLASLGVAQVRVYERPRVGVLALGDELIPPPAPLGPGQIRVSNLYAVAASVTKHGGVARNLGIARDQPDDIQRALAQADDVDLLITLGGSQRGDFDFVEDLLSGAQGRLLLRDIAANYVRSMLFGYYGQTPLCGLPGSPIAAYVAFEAFVRQAIWKLAGRRRLDPPRLEAFLTEPLPATRERAHFQPVWVEVRRDHVAAIPLAVAKAADLPPLTLANGLIYRGPESPRCAAGTRVWVQMIEPPALCPSPHGEA